MIEVLFEIFGELIFQVVISLLGELFSGTIGAGFNSLSQKRVPPAVKAMLYLCAGCVLGWVSLLVFPHPFAQRPEARMIVLIGTPVACGVLMGLFKALVTNRREQGHGELINLYGFTYGVLFAFPVALARFLWAH